MIHYETKFQRRIVIIVEYIRTAFQGDDCRFNLSEIQLEVTLIFRYNF